MSDFYEVLQVRPDAEPEVVRAAYRALAKKCHPDFGGDQRRMVGLNAAWAVLGDPARRAAYDQFRAGEATRPAAAPVPPARPAMPGSASWTRPQPRPSGTVLDFGRYSGWSIGQLVGHDPDYLEWLARTPIGRPFRHEIDERLAARGPVSTQTRPPARAGRG